MLFESHIVLFLQRQTIVVYLVSSGFKKPKQVMILPLHELEIATSAQKDAFISFLNEKKAARIYILLEEDLCYFISLAMPKQLEQSTYEAQKLALIEQLYAKAKLHIPDEFDQSCMQIAASDWQNRTLTISVPVQKQYQLISSVLTDNSREVAFFSSVSFATKKDVNGVIGIVRLAAEGHSLVWRNLGLFLNTIGIPYAWQRFVVFLLLFSIVGVVFSAVLTIYSQQFLLNLK